jgi:hypothetical protein
MNNLILYIILGIFIPFYIAIIVFICLSLKQSRSNFRHEYYTIPLVFEDTGEHYLLKNNRTDMLGSFGQGFIVTIITLLAKNKNPHIMINKTKKLFTDWSDFNAIPLDLLQDPNSKIEKDKWQTVGIENMKNHTDARRIFISNIFPNRVKQNISNIKEVKVKNTETQITDGMLRNPNVLKFTEMVRNNFRKYLPSAFVNDNCIVIHYRAGDVLKQSKRFTHSSKYLKICKELKEKYPEIPIYVFTSKKPHVKSDNLEVFKKYAKSIFDASDYKTIECWAVFMHCRIFVMSYSCTSVTPALLRDLKNITYYDKIDRKLPDKSWKYWYKT